MVRGPTPFSGNEMAACINDCDDIFFSFGRFSKGVRCFTSANDETPSVDAFFYVCEGWFTGGRGRFVYSQAAENPSCFALLRIS